MEKLKKLKLINIIENYQYIGMGSIHYYDFILMYKFLNIQNSVSIDDKETKKRFEFNRPYQFVEFENEKTTIYLARLDWKKIKNHLIWLDYDSKLEYFMLDDISLVLNNCNAQDILIVTIDGRCPLEIDPKNPENKPREEFWNNFEPYISDKYKDSSNINPENFPDIIQDICFNYIRDKEIYAPFKYYNIFSYKYSDTAEMYTFGGIFDNSDKSLKNIKNEKFVSLTGDMIEIDAPILTYHEKIHLDQEIKKCKHIIKEYSEEIQKALTDGDKKKITKKYEKKMKKELPFELTSIQDLIYYVDYCKYYPQYYEGLI
jgi:hypothetical protein